LEGEVLIVHKINAILIDAIISPIALSTSITFQFFFFWLSMAKHRTGRGGFTHKLPAPGVFQQGDKVITPLHCSMLLNKKKETEWGNTYIPVMGIITNVPEEPDGVYTINIVGNLSYQDVSFTVKATSTYIHPRTHLYEDCQFELEEILDDRVHSHDKHFRCKKNCKSKRDYRIKWVGWAEPTFEPDAHIPPEAIAFYKAYGPYRREVGQQIEVWLDDEDTSHTDFAAELRDHEHSEDAVCSEFADICNEEFDIVFTNKSLQEAIQFRVADAPLDITDFKNIVAPLLSDIAKRKKAAAAEQERSEQPGEGSGTGAASTEGGAAAALRSRECHDCKQNILPSDSHTCVKCHRNVHQACARAPSPKAQAGVCKTCRSKLCARCNCPLAAEGRILCGRCGFFCCANCARLAKVGDKVENRCKACLPGPQDSSIQGQGSYRPAPEGRTTLAAVALATDIAAAIAVADTADMATDSRVAAPAAAPAESAIVEAATATGAAAASMAAPTASADAAVAAPVTLPVAAKLVRQQLGDSPEVSSDTETSDATGTSDDTGDDAPPPAPEQGAAVPSAVVAQSNMPGPAVTAAPTKKAGEKRKADGEDKQRPLKQGKINMQSLTLGKKGKP
jgi:hypothetical protein